MTKPAGHIILTDLGPIRISDTHDASIDGSVVLDCDGLASSEHEVILSQAQAIMLAHALLDVAFKDRS